MHDRCETAMRSLAEGDKTPSQQRSLLPGNPPPNDAHDPDESQQHGHLDERADGGGQGLIAVGAVGGDGYGDGKLKVVAGGGEALGAAKTVAKAEAMDDEERDEEDEGKVDDQGCADADDRHYLVHDPLALRREEDEDGEDEPNQRQRADDLDKDAVVPAGAGQLSDGEAGDDGRAQGNSQEDSDALGHGRVVDGDRPGRTADYSQVEDRERRKEDHLQNRVDRDEDGTVVAVASSQVVPDQNLSSSVRDRLVRRLWAAGNLPLRCISRCQPISNLLAANPRPGERPTRGQPCSASARRLRPHLHTVRDRLGTGKGRREKKLPSPAAPRSS